MPHHDVYTLHIYRSRAASGWQWAARLEHLPGGESRRFTDREALLAHLQAIVRDGQRADPTTEVPAEVDGPAGTERGGTGHRDRDNAIPDC
jgi:hypothetical protein